MPDSKPTAKRSPSILVTDVRNQPSKRSTAPFAGAAQSLKNKHRTRSSGDKLKQSKFSNISVSQILSDASEIPASLRRLSPSSLPYSNDVRTLRNRHGLDRQPKHIQPLPARTSKTSEKLVYIPEDDVLDAEYHESSSHNYSRSGPLLRKHVSPAADKMYSSTQEEIRKLNKDKDLLPRVTAYYVADAINLENAAGFLKRNHRVWCKLYDEVLYVPYQLPLLEGDNGFRVKSNVYKKNSIGQSKLEANIKQSEQRDYHFEYYSGQENEEHKDKKEDEEGDNYAREFKSSNEEDNFDPYEPQYFNYKEQPALVENTVVDHAEVFLYSYGVIVFWNFSKNQEENILADISFYSSDEAGSEMLISKVDEMDFETEEFHVEYDKSAKVPRIFNDLITLKSGDHLIKMTLSHAIAQSTKLCRFESRVQDVLYSVAKLPKILALTGQLGINRQQLLRKSGKLFKLRVDVNLSSNVLDVPEFFWSFEPSLNPLYTGARDYLEIDERVEVINDRCKVFLEFINVISDSIAESNMNKITWIIIVIIAISLLVSCLEIFIRYRIINKE